MEEIKNYIDNPLFIQWVFNPNSDLTDYWTLYISKHPEEKDLLLALKTELDYFRISEQELTEKQKTYLAVKIAGTIQKKQKNTQIRQLSLKILNYAAIAALLLTIGGGIVYLYFDRNDISEYAGLLERMPQEYDNPTLVLSDGTNVDLDLKESEVEYNSNNQVVVNKDSVINLQSNNKEIENNLNFLLIPYGNRSKIVLNDNTVVWLNAGSRLIYPSVFTEKEREVTLFGEAFFEVTEDKGKPFIVKTPNYSIKVLGTRFNISAYPNDKISQTVLTQGKVELKVNNGNLFDKKYTLSPNEMFTFDSESQQSAVKKVNPQKYVSWKDGLLICENEDLNRVIKKLERFYDIRIVFENSIDGAIKISGKLDLKEDKHEVFYYISEVTKRNVTEKNNGVFVIK